MVQHIVEETSGDKKKMSALMFNVWKQFVFQVPGRFSGALQSNVLPTVCDTCKKHITTNIRRHISKSASVNGVFEPTDINTGPEIPEYPVLDVKITGYDFVPLENFARYVHSLADGLGLDTDSWPVPSADSQIKVFKKNTTLVQSTFDLKKYARVVQLQNVPSTVLPMFMQVARSHLPEGIDITIQITSEEEEEDRYIPDKELESLQAEIEAINAAREERRR